MNFMKKNSDQSLKNKIIPQNEIHLDLAVKRGI